MLGMRRSIFLPALALAACTARDPEPAPGEIVWSPGTAVDTADLPAPRGWREYRGIVHLHSWMSHDACDGHERPEFTDEQCLANLRAGICATAQDYIFLTDHPARYEDHEYPETLLYAEGDELVVTNGKPVANRLRCDDGRAVLLQAGYESTNLMPGGLAEHADPDPAVRAALYDATDATTIARLREKGALLFLPHTESKEFGWYATVPLAGMEIYNLHANVDPRIRENHLGLDGIAYLADMLKFAEPGEDGPHPDLAFLTFFAPNDVSLRAWERMLAVRKVAGLAGTDAHENVFVNRMRDGERGDSYRRMMSFFSNRIRVREGAGPLPLAAPRAAIESLHGFVAFEALGVPAGFDFYAEGKEGAVEMGGDASVGDALVVSVPRVYGLNPKRTPPAVVAVVYRIAGGERTEIARGSHDLRIPLAAPGIYRVEVRMTPHHLAEELGEFADRLIVEYPWIYSNPVFVAP